MIAGQMHKAYPVIRNGGIMLYTTDTIENRL